MKKILFLSLSLLWLASCDKQFVCNCGTTGGAPYKKVYLQSKTEKGAKRRCTKLEESGETCTLQ